MPYKMVLEHNLGCILFHFHSSSSAYQVEDAFQVILKTYRQTGFRRVLFDLNHADDSLMMLERYQVDQKLLRKDLLNIRLAAFAGAPKADMTLVKPFANLKVFENEKAARDWLFQEQVEKMTGIQPVSRAEIREISNYGGSNATVSM